MTARITGVEVFGFKGSPSGTGTRKVKRARHDATEKVADDRFKQLRANWLRITGTNLDEVGLCDLKFTFGPGGHTFVAIETVPVEDSDDKELDVYFVVWVEKGHRGKVLDLGDLTVTVETTSATQPGVEIED